MGNLKLGPQLDACADFRVHEPFPTVLRGVLLRMVFVIPSGSIYLYSR